MARGRIGARREDYPNIHLKEKGPKSRLNPSDISVSIIPFSNTTLRSSRMMNTVNIRNAGNFTI